MITMFTRSFLLLFTLILHSAYLPDDENALVKAYGIQVPDGQAIDRNASEATRKIWMRECEEIEQSAASVYQDLNADASLLVSVAREQYLVQEQLPFSPVQSVVQYRYAHMPPTATGYTPSAMQAACGVPEECLGVPVAREQYLVQEQLPFYPVQSVVQYRYAHMPPTATGYTPSAMQAACGVPEECLGVPVASEQDLLKNQRIFSPGQNKIQKLQSSIMNTVEQYVLKNAETLVVKDKVEMTSEEQGREQARRAASIFSLCEEDVSIDDIGAGIDTLVLRWNGVQTPEGLQRSGALHMLKNMVYKIKRLQSLIERTISYYMRPKRRKKSPLAIKDETKRDRGDQSRALARASNMMYTRRIGIARIHAKEATSLDEIEEVIKFVQSLPEAANYERIKSELDSLLKAADTIREEALNNRHTVSEQLKHEISSMKKRKISSMKSSKSRTNKV